MAKRISLTQGQFAIVDDDDYSWLSQWKWYAGRVRATENFYAQRSVNKAGKISGIKMHRLILKANRVDHHDGNTLNNRRKNLRRATPRQNSQNRKTARHNRTGLKGVQLPYVGAQSYRARIQINGQMKRLGSFPTAEDAARAYDREALRHFGKFARLNFPIKGNANGD